MKRFKYRLPRKLKKRLKKNDYSGVLNAFKQAFEIVGEVVKLAEEQRLIRKMPKFEPGGIMVTDSSTEEFIIPTSQLAKHQTFAADGK